MTVNTYTCETVVNRIAYFSHYPTEWRSYRIIGTHDVWFFLRLWLFLSFFHSLVAVVGSTVALSLSLSLAPSLTPSLCLSTIPFSRCSIVHETGIICYIIFYIYYWMLSTLNTTICRYGFFVFKFFAWSMSKIKTLSVCVRVCHTFILHRPQCDTIWPNVHDSRFILYIRYAHISLSNGSKRASEPTRWLEVNGQQRREKKK